jgi:outer membrane protein assembly factor BamB
MNKRNKWILIGVIALVLLALGATAGLYYHDQTKKRTVRGSSTVEFVPTDKPGEKKRPHRVVEETPWPMYGYDMARSHVAADFRHRPPFRRVWSRETGDYIEFPPAVADKRVFVANQHGDFLAIRSKDGKVVWRKDFGSCIAASPAVARGVVVQGVMNPKPCARGNRTSQPGFVVAMNAKTGRQVWRFRTGVIESSPLVVDKTVYVGSWNHKVYALNLKNGRVRWSYDTGEEIDSSAAYADGTVYIGANEGHVYALNAWTGALRWRASSFSRFGRREYFYATPTVAYGRVYIGNTDGTLYAFGAKTGDLLWAQNAGTYVYSGAAVWRHRVYIGTYDGRLRAFDAATGDPMWSWNAPAKIHGAPTVMAGLVYFATATTGPSAHPSRYVKHGPRGVYAVNARTGKLVWQHLGIGQYSPVVADAERTYLVGATRVYGLESRKQVASARPHKTRKHRKRGR